MVGAPKNIFLDFLSPENHLIYGTISNLSINQQVSIFSESLNVAVLLCGEYCVLPPFFILQSRAVQITLQKKAFFLQSGLVRIPLRESSLESFFYKKMDEYAAVRDLYPGLYDEKGRKVLEGSAQFAIRRNSTVGQQIASQWLSGPDAVSLHWSPLKRILTASEIEKLRKIPSDLKMQGRSVTWPAMLPHMNSEMKRAAFEINQALQAEYAQIYLEEFNALTISGAPPKTTEFFQCPFDASYDFATFTRTLAALDLWEPIKEMSAEEIVALKFSAAFLDFLRLFRDACFAASNQLEIIHYFARGCERIRYSKGTLRNSAVSRISLQLFGRQRMPRVIDTLHEVAINLDSASLPETPVALNRGRAFFITRRPKMSKVFIVHGHDHAVRDKIILFLHEMKLDNVVLEREVMSGEAYIAEFERLADECSYAIIIATPDDEFFSSDATKRVVRLRQNVVLETGYFWGKNGRKKKLSILLKSDPNLELPSDIVGLGYIPITEDLGETKFRLTKELREAGILA